MVSEYTRVPGLLRVYAAFLVIVGLVLAAGGVRLVLESGSPYYVICGLACLVSGILLWRANAFGATLYGVLFLGTIIWALWEVGLDGWALMPRVVAIAVVGVVLLLPSVRRVLSGNVPWSYGRIFVAIIVAIVVGIGVHSVVPPVQNADPLFQTGMGPPPAAHDSAQEATAAASDWLHYGGDQAGTRFSSLTQLTPQNVAGLKEAWKVRLGSGAKSYGFEDTPLKVGDTLYACTSRNDMIALDAETGVEKWHYHANIDESHGPFQGCRGVAYYKRPTTTGKCAEEIITNTIDARLIAVDALDGNPCPDFGTDGQVSLLPGLSDKYDGYYLATSAPTIVRGKIIVGGFVLDNQYWGEPSGVIRAFDAATGQLAWAWDMGHPDQHGLPPDGQKYTPSSPNAWAPMSADETAGLVYVPLGNPTPDYFGAQRRPFDEKYGDAIVALDADTGELRWSFQTVHHDLWDYDLPGQPTLIDIPTAQGTVPALIQPTKRGDVFVVNRLTGEPVYPVTEMPVPQQGGAPEDHLSPTQPFSNALPSFRSAKLTERDMWGITPLDQLWCRIKYRGARYDGIFTPPGPTPALETPSILGGMEWGSIAVDVTHSIAIINSSKFINYTRLVPRAEADQRHVERYKSGITSHYSLNSAQEGTPYAILTNLFMSPLDVPCHQPPYGKLAAVDLTTGHLLWEQTFGTARKVGPFDIESHLPFKMGVPNIGGAVVTKTGLFFIGATMDGYLRAYDTLTGKELWRADLPASGNATPMTYQTQDGRQFVVIAAGGHASMGVHGEDYLVAYALPKP